MRVVAILLIVAAAGLFALLPPSAIVVSSNDQVSGVRGAIHVHSRRSDGTGTVDDIARAAARAGLSFVIVTDHGDGAREPAPPGYIADVLIIDALEIATEQGHVVALGLPQTPYPLGGEARDVVEDIHRLGGWALAAHPGSPKVDLAWQDWTLPLDALEWLNFDSEWRDETVPSLLRVLLTYPLRPSEALTTLLDRPDDIIERWDTLARSRHVVGLAASDAHARLGLTSIGEPYDARSLPLPSYEAVFSALSIGLTGVSLTRTAATDGAAVVQAIREGRVYSTIDGLARGGTLAFSAISGQGRAEAGQRLAIDGSVTMSASAVGPPSARMTLYRDGTAIKSVDGLVLEESLPSEPAVYRVEVSLPGVSGSPPVPWMVGNPIYVGGAAAASPSTEDCRPASRQAWTSDQLNAGRVERSAASEGAVSVTRATDARELLFRYALGGRPSEHPYAAAVLPVGSPLDMVSRIRFSARADRPMRMSVQLRSSGPGDGDRWRRSIYLDETPRMFDIPLSALRAVGPAVLEQRLSAVDSLLLVVDDLNTPLGNGGRVWLKDLEIVK